MTLDELNNFLITMRDAATVAGHIWPDYAACEAALESAWGQSKLYIEAKNIFGMKQHVHPEYGTLSLPTHEFLGGAWQVVNAAWVEYPDLASCFADRMATLQRLAPAYVHYARALAATSGDEYVSEVSVSWSTDPLRAEKVLNIYSVHHSVFGEPTTTPPASSPPPEDTTSSESSTTPDAATDPTLESS